MAGFFITLEGGECSGKTTQGCLLYETLRREGHDVVLTAEPSSWLSHYVFDERTDPMAQLFLFLADRAQHLADTIRPALEGGQVVICDRFIDSTTVYQSLTLGLTMPQLEYLNRICVGEYEPDLTLVLDIPAEEVGERLAQRLGVPRGFDTKPVDFHVQVRGRFWRLVGKYPRFQRVDASQPIEKVRAEIEQIVMGRMQG